MWNVYCILLFFKSQTSVVVVVVVVLLTRFCVWVTLCLPLWWFYYSCCYHLQCEKYAITVSFFYVYMYVYISSLFNFMYVPLWLWLHECHFWFNSAYTGVYLVLYGLMCIDVCVIHMQHYPYRFYKCYIFRRHLNIFLSFTEMNIKPHTKTKECVSNKTTTTNVWELKKKTNKIHYALQITWVLHPKDGVMSTSKTSAIDQWTTRWITSTYFNLWITMWQFL